jgi:hypothetical protein
MPLRNILIFSAGTIAGAAVMFIVLTPDVPPAPQETTKIEVNVFQLTPKDQWLEKVRFQIIPLDGVDSRHKYAVLVLTPPPGGIHVQNTSSAVLDLAPATKIFTEDNSPGIHDFPGGVQPIQIESSDFGANGDEVVVKFIDELIRTDKSYYQPSQHLWIGSAPNQ